jgi:hypothetical protein
MPPIIISTMPALGAADPANLEAQARADLDFSWLLEQFRWTSPHPALGSSSNSYAHEWFCEERLQKFYAGEAIDVLTSSIFCWAIRLVSYRQTGKMERNQIVTSQTPKTVGQHIRLVNLKGHIDFFAGSFWRTKNRLIFVRGPFFM